jgi:hypothetical protein
MIISLKHRIMLWVPCLAYIVLVVGEVQQRVGGDTVLRVTTRGGASALLVFCAALCLTSGDRGWFITGVIFWVLGLCALLLGNGTLFVVHW